MVWPILCMEWEFEFVENELLCDDISMLAFVLECGYVI